MLTSLGLSEPHDGTAGLEDGAEMPKLRKLPGGSEMPKLPGGTGIAEIAGQYRNCRNCRAAQGWQR